MKLSVFALLLLFSSGFAQAAPAWEVCLDNSDYTLSVSDSFLNFVKLAKSGCTMRFLSLGGKGEKLEVNLCDANIHVDQYTAIDASEHATQYAGSAGCPSPMFGADFNERADDLQKYDAAKARVMAIMAIVIKTYGKNLANIKMDALKATDINSSEGKTACSNYLIKQYLEQCTAFEEKKHTGQETVKPFIPAPMEIMPAMDLPPGVHPATIRKN
jgi:hypothetical protein